MTATGTSSSSLDNTSIWRKIEQVRSNSCTEMHFIGYASGAMTEEHVRGLADALKHNTRLKTLRLKGQNLSAESVAILSQAVAEHPCLENFKLTACGIEDDGLRAAITSLRHSSLHNIGFSGNNFTNAIMPYMPELLRNPNLTKLSLWDAFAEPVAYRDGYELLGRVARHVGHRNLVEIMPRDADAATEEYLKRNTQQARQLGMRLKSIAWDAWSVAETAELYARLPAVVEILQSGSVKTIEKLEERLDTLPLHDFATQKTVRADAAGFTRWDNPLTWRHYAQAERTGVEGISISKAEWMQLNHDGEPAMATGIRCGYLPQIIQGLLHQGEVITAQDLLTENREPSPLYQAIIEARAHRHVFVQANWESQSVSALRAAYEVLPEEAQEDLSHYTGLQIAVRQAAIRRGREANEHSVGA